MYESLNSYDWRNNGNKEKWDFTGDINKEVPIKNFYKLNQEVGIAGEYTYDKDTSKLTENQLLNQLMSCMPNQIDITQFDTKQKYLPTFSESDAQGAVEKFVDVNAIIKLNQFGYLPSNLSQLLFYMDYEGIASILNLSSEGVKDIKANWEDGKLESDNVTRKSAFIKLLVTTNKKFIGN